MWDANQGKERGVGMKKEQGWRQGGLGERRRETFSRDSRMTNCLTLSSMKGGMVPTRNPGNLAVFLNSVMTVLYLSATIFLSTWGEAKAGGV